jgi:hypothetical protein
MNNLLVPFAMVCIGSAMAASSEEEQAEHSRVVFNLTVKLPYEQAFPLFGAWNEQKWAADWHPQFLYPVPAEDREGAVFRVEHGHRSAIWMTTRFDLAAGVIEHVYVLNGLLFTRIHLRLSKDEASATKVEVVYERTAIRPEGAEHVKAMAADDAKAGPEWQRALDAYAKR